MQTPDKQFETNIMRQMIKYHVQQRYFCDICESGVFYIHSTLTADIILYLLRRPVVYSAFRVIPIDE